MPAPPACLKALEMSKLSASLDGKIRVASWVLSGGEKMAVAGDAMQQVRPSLKGYHTILLLAGNFMQLPCEARLNYFLSIIFHMYCSPGQTLF